MYIIFFNLIVWHTFLLHFDLLFLLFLLFIVFLLKEELMMCFFVKCILPSLTKDVCYNAISIDDFSFDFVN